MTSTAGPAGQGITSTNEKLYSPGFDLDRFFELHSNDQDVYGEDLISFKLAFVKAFRAHEMFFELSPVGYLILDKDGIIEKANRQSEMLLGLTQKAMVGRRFSEFLADTPTEGNSFLNQSSFSAEIQRLDCEVNRYNGSTFPALLSAINIFDDAGICKNILTVMLDMSNSVGYQHDIKRSLDKATQLNEMYSSFMAIAAHEFRTPLSAVLSSNSLVEKYSELGKADMMQKHLTRIRSSVKSMVDIIEDFLSLEKLESGNFEIIKTNFNLVSFCEDILEEVFPLMKSGQKVTCVNTGKPEICSDQKALRHILLNLLTNACKYSDENSQVRLLTDVNAGRVIISVKDTGIGIPLMQQDKIFTRFFRAPNAVHIHGTGLGLYICKRYVELLGGTINFTSRANHGTTFVVKIPVRTS